jgi:hypothetical protein
MSAGPEGMLKIRLTWDGTAISAVDITPRRLLDPNLAVRGKPPQEAAQALPLLYSLCGQAQGVAAQLALAAAQGRTGVTTAQARTVIAEAMRESAWHFLIDLPRHFGLPPAPQKLAQLRNDPAAGMRWEELYACSGLTGLKNEAGGASGIPLLPEFDARQMADEILPSLLCGANFASHPEWRGTPAETGAAARRKESGSTAASRLRARYEELPQLATALRDDATLMQLGWLKQVRVGENSGLAWLQTSRGLLIHYAQVKNGVVADYRIVAPTEWNFHPRGAYARGLTGQPAASLEEARRHAELLLLALDPCVEHEIGIDHA